MNIEEVTRAIAESTFADDERVQWLITEVAVWQSMHSRAYSLGLARAAEIADGACNGLIDTPDKYPYVLTVAQAIRAEAAAPAVCEWRCKIGIRECITHEECHLTDCKIAHYGGTKRFKFCPYCGKSIAIKEG